MNNLDYPELTKDKYFKFIKDKDGFLILSKMINGNNIEIWSNVIKDVMEYGINIPDILPKLCFFLN